MVIFCNILAKSGESLQIEGVVYNPLQQSISGQRLKILYVALLSLLLEHNILIAKEELKSF